jgi:carbonic anhydrase
VFDQGFGDLFVIRVAGNVISPGVAGSLDYALEHLGTRLFVVLGHQSCGAVTAAFEAAANPAMQEMDAIRSLLKLIEPSIKNIDPKLPKAARVAAGVEANVRWSMQQLKEHEAVKKPLAEKKIRLVGGVYDLSSGLVRFLDD